MFFFFLNILIPNVAEKNILILEEEKEKSDSEFLSYNLMLFSGKKICTSRDKKIKYSNSRVVRKKNSEQNKKHNPPCKLNGRSLKDVGMIKVIFGPITETVYVDIILNKIIER